MISLQLLVVAFQLPPINLPPPSLDYALTGKCQHCTHKLIMPFVNFHIISHLVWIDLCSPGKSLAAGFTCRVRCADSAYRGGLPLLSRHMMLQQSTAKLFVV